LVESFSTIEHPLHDCDLGHVLGTDIFVECHLAVKQLAHGGNEGHVPFADVSVLLLCRSRILAPEVNSLFDVSITSGLLVEYKWAKCLLHKVSIES